MRRQRSSGRRQYPRVARINELLREILAEALDRIDDDELVLVTITGVHCDPDLRRAQVFFDGPRGAEGDAEVAEALEAIRYKLQRAVATQTSMKHTPELRFSPDPAVRAGEHIDEVLRNVPPARLDEEGAEIPADAVGGAEDVDGGIDRVVGDVGSADGPVVGGE